MNTSTSVPATPARETFWLRLLRGGVLFGLAASLTIIIALFVVGRFAPILWPTFMPDTPKLIVAFKILAALILYLAIFLPLGLVAVLGRKPWLGWKVLGLGWLAVLPVLLWLAWDDPAVRRPLPLEEFSPAFAGAEQSYAVLMRYSRQTTDPEAKAFDNAAKLIAVPWGIGLTREPAKWAGLVADARRRAAIEANWAALAPQRRWAAELNAFDRLGDLTPARFDANVISVQVWRSLAQHACAIATLQALDGHGDDAITTLVPMLELGRKLQPSSRTLVRSMTGVGVERMCLETAGIVLDHAPVSVPVRAQLSAALANDQAPALARRLLLIEYAQFSPLYGTMRLGNLATQDGGFLALLRRPLNWFSGLLFNPNATTNLYGQQVFELASLAEARELGKFGIRSKGFQNATWHQSGMKNIGGRLLIQMAMPSYEGVIESYWKTADLRAALRARLAAPSA